MKPSFNSQETEKQTELYFNRLIRKAQNNSNMLGAMCETAEGVYLDIVNVSLNKIQLLHKTEIPYEENVLFLDMSLSMLEPPIHYIRLMRSIGIRDEECKASVVGFNKYERDNGKYSVYPIIAGGSYNPYKKYKSNRVSACRRIETISNLSRITNQKVFIMNFNLTFPKQISKHFLEDNDSKLKIEAIHNLFWERVLDENILSIDDKKYQTTQGLQSGLFSNLHKSKSKNPFEAHYHFHDIIPNFLYDKKNKRFVRLQPYLNKSQLKKLRILWYECQKEVLNYGQTNGSIYSEFDIEPDKVDLWFQYLEGYKANLPTPEYIPNLNYPNALREHKQKYKEYKNNDRARSRIAHLFKYCTRSYLVDVGNYFDFYDSDNDFVRFTKYSNYHKSQFKKFVDKGCIPNKTSVKGYLRNLKQITRDHDKKRNSNIYIKCFGKKDRETFHCSITGQKCEKKVKHINIFEDIGSLNLYIAYKSGMIKISTLNFRGKKEVD